MIETITTLHRLRRYLGITNQNTSDDDRLLLALAAASAYVEGYTGRQFLPYRASIPHEVVPGLPGALLLTEDLLQLLAVTDADGTVPLDDITLLPADGPANLLHYDGVFALDGSPGGDVIVDGVWGWNLHPVEMFRDSGDIVLDFTLDASATTINVGDADALADDGISPRFAAGMLLSLGTEYLRLHAVDGTANTLTVERGVRGTPAIPHTQGLSVQVYVPPADVEVAVLQLAAAFYRQPDLRAPDEVPGAALATLQRLRRALVRV